MKTQLHAFKECSWDEKESKNDMYSSILNHFLNKASCRSRVSRLNMGNVYFHSHSNCQSYLSMSTFHGTLYSILNYCTCSVVLKDCEGLGTNIQSSRQCLAKHLGSLYFKHARDGYIPVIHY